MPNISAGGDFLQIFKFQKDESIPGRVLSSAKIGDVYMARITIAPGQVTGNKYHKETRRMFYVARGRVRGVFENISTKERRELLIEPLKQAFHLPENVALAFKNEGKGEAVIIFFSNKPVRSDDNFEYKLL